jgi:CheY-like chemotaxis protein
MQSSRSLDRAQGGLGIGLTLAKELTELHDGTIQVFSEGLEKGSEFVVRLPTISPKPSDLRSSTAEGRLASASGSQRILVVDDNRDEAESLAILMRLSQYQVEIAHSGAAALDLAAKFKPDVIFLDIGMPGMNGYEVASQLRRQPQMKAQLVALTGYGQEEDRRRAYEAGFNHHFTKPVEPTALLKLLATLFPATPNDRELGLRSDEIGSQP